MNDDLLSTVVAYATTKVSLTLLTTFLPISVYNPHIWRQKVQRESRGMATTEESWYALYLLSNRTLWGNVLTAKINSSSGAIERKSVSISPEIVIFDRTVEGSAYGRIRQLPNLDIVHVDTKGKQYVLGNINRRLYNARTTFVSSSGPPHAPTTTFSFVDEYGDLWLHGFGILQLILSGKGLVSAILTIGILDDGVEVLIMGRTRDGFEQYRVVLPLSRRVGEIYVYGMYHAPQLPPLEDLVRAEETTVRHQRAILKALPQHPLRPIQYTQVSILTMSRTIYGTHLKSYVPLDATGTPELALATRTRPSPIRETLNVTQQMQVDHNKLYAVVDPS